MTGNRMPQGDDEWSILGMDCFFQKMYDSAIVFLSTAIEKEPHEGMNYYVRALTYLELGRKKEAQMDFLIAIECGVHVTEEFMSSCNDDPQQNNGG